MDAQDRAVGTHVFIKRCIKTKKAWMAGPNPAEGRAGGSI
jgi:hypothetical protein